MRENKHSRANNHLLVVKNNNTSWSVCNKVNPIRTLIFETFFKTVFHPGKKLLIGPVVMALLVTYGNYICPYYGQYSYLTFGNYISN
jgi:hypothetical protein